MAARRCQVLMLTSWKRLCCFDYAVSTVNHRLFEVCFALYQIFATFAPESIKSSHLLMDSPTEQLEPRWSVRCGSNIYKLQKFQVMQHHIYYIKFALQFADKQIPELVNIFNSQVQNRGWTSMRAYHNRALIDELGVAVLILLSLRMEKPFLLPILSGTNYAIIS